MSANTTAAPDISVPLCVDLDGTLIRSDVLWVSMKSLLGRNLLYLLLIPGWFLRGRALLKREIALRTELNPATLPYHLPFLEYLKAEHAQGRRLILATAADRQLAQIVAQYVGLFSDVVASDGRTNLRGSDKGRALSQRFGAKAFDYAGNSSVDLPVWEQSRRALVVNGSARLVARARRIADVSHVFN